MLSVDAEAKSILHGGGEDMSPDSFPPSGTLFETPAAQLRVTKAEPAERGHVSKKNSRIAAN
jgi:hypothetical protein